MDWNALIDGQERIDSRWGFKMLVRTGSYHLELQSAFQARRRKGSLPVRLLGSLMAFVLPPLEKVELRTESQSEGTGEEERSSIDAARGGLEEREGEA